jgi:hypothetical protein
MRYKLVKLIVMSIHDAAMYGKIYLVQLSNIEKITISSIPIALEVPDIKLSLHCF